ncbi:MAG: glycosyl transferase [Chloroflexi bacterium]|nr:MAG: glycosyl transferase [Chloroflexota bacterium]
MRIAQIAPLQAATPPHAYGGTERVIYNLTESLVQLGHEVTLFATGDSRTSARLVPAVAEAVNFDPDTVISAYHIAMLADVYRQASDFDLIHSHLDHLTLPFIGTTRTPTVLTLHGRVDTPELERVYGAYAGANYVAISHNQRRSQPNANWIATVHNGIDVKNYTYHPVAGDYLCFVGRISPDKRPERAIEVAKRVGIPLKIAAKIGPEDRQYFTSVVEPMFDHPLIEFLGQLDETSKRELIGNALALLAPIDWPEPFGMVFIEALASGTPVLTCPVGSAPELLADGVTGYLRQTVDELVEAVGQLGDISRSTCRRYALERFDMRRMTLGYTRIYSQLQNPAVSLVKPAAVDQRAPVQRSPLGSTSGANAPLGDLSESGAGGHAQSTPSVASDVL